MMTLDPPVFIDRLRDDFDDPSLLTLALTHRSWCAEHAGDEPNERLEFLGDAVLQLVVTDHIFRTYRAMPEGELSKLRTALVSASTLAEVAAELRLGEQLRLGKGEATSGGRERRSNLADALEAVFGAVYLDRGLDAARELILRLLGDRVALAALEPGVHDYKSQLQELAMREVDELPTYHLRDEGPDHEKRFYAEVHLGGVVRGHGEGRSKKEAEQAAARAAWDAMAGGVVGEGSEGLDGIAVVAGPEGASAVAAPPPAGAATEPRSPEREGDGHA